MAKYTLEMKFDVVQYVLEKNNSQKEAARQFGVNRGQIQMWIDTYLRRGLEGIAAKNGTYPGDFKVSVIEHMHKNALSPRQTAAEFNIPSFTTVCTAYILKKEHRPYTLTKEAVTKPKTNSDY